MLKKINPADPVDSVKNNPEAIQDELDRRTYHLKTLYDVSKDIFGSVDFGTILKDFLLMTMGNFGVMEGFILSLDESSGEINHFECMGFQESGPAAIREYSKKLLSSVLPGEIRGDGKAISDETALPTGAVYALPFQVVPGSSGLLGLGEKLTGEPYSEDDKELLLTLVNSMTVALKNARSFESIKQLNQELVEKNAALETALSELQASMKKVEILEGIKANLSKFVPVTVSRLIEKSPTASIPESREQDVSVLFLDIEGYTTMSEQLGSSELNNLVEQYFSVFMDAIHANNGDVNETAGDGLMVLFLSKDRTMNALEAVRTASIIRQKTSLINLERGGSSVPLVINMGINSGPALVGAAKFDSYTGSRWTYTARGMITNIAARIGAVASDGAVLLSGSTAERVKGHFPVSPMGKFSLKNVSDQVEIFSVDE